ncbi:hypothetical protein B0H14DRAFT_2575602 [Mycena olivaceomarginata]|nr:hypothetical protein B0H14DRAFT_2575602 [Mycena olivaceomarginata]
MVSIEGTCGLLDKWNDSQVPGWDCGVLDWGSCGERKQDDHGGGEQHFSDLLRDPGLTVECDLVMLVKKEVKWRVLCTQDAAYRKVAARLGNFAAFQKMAEQCQEVWALPGIKEIRETRHRRCFSECINATRSGRPAHEHGPEFFFFPSNTNQRVLGVPLPGDPAFSDQVRGKAIDGKRTATICERRSHSRSGWTRQKVACRKTPDINIPSDLAQVAVRAFFIFLHPQFFLVGFKFAGETSYEGGFSLTRSRSFAGVSVLREAITVNHSQYFTIKHIQTQPGLNKGGCFDGLSAFGKHRLPFGGIIRQIAAAASLIHLFRQMLSYGEMSVARCQVSAPLLDI